MSGSSATLQLHHRDAFERNVTRALFAGAGAGALHFLAFRAGAVLAPKLGFGTPGMFPGPDMQQLLPLTYVAIVGTSLAAARGDRLDRLLLMALSVVLPGIPWLLGVSPEWTIGLSGAAAGGLMVRSHLSERGADTQVGGERPGYLNYALGAALTGGLAVAGTTVARALSSRLLFDFSTPALLVCLLAGLMLSLFVGIGSIAAHLALKPDPVEARCEELIPNLTGELKTLATRALNLYRECGKALAQLPREPAREEMARTLSKMTREAVELAAEWSHLEQQLEAGANHGLASQLADLTQSALAAKDPIARQQLELAASALREELQRLEDLKVQRERIVAKLKAEVALLERARVVLIGMRGGQMQLKAAELSALARKFNTLSSLQSVEARMAGALATNAELAQHELNTASARTDAELSKGTPASALTPISPVAAEPAPEGTDAQAAAPVRLPER
jgi:hypothetical protein